MTENLRKEQLSLAYARTIAGLAGFNLSIPEVDNDSVDIQVQASGDFHSSSPRLDIQLKATADPAAVRPDSVSWRLKQKNYDDLRRRTMVPRVLVVMVLPAGMADWYGQSEDELSVRKAAYWLSLVGAPGVDHDTTTVSIPRAHLLTPKALRQLMLDPTWRPGQ